MSLCRLLCMGKLACGGLFHVRHHVGSSGLVAVRLDGWAGFVMAVDFEDVAAGLMMEAESTRSDVVVVLL